MTGVGGLEKNLKKKVRDYLRLTVILLAGKTPQNWSSRHTPELRLQKSGCTLIQGHQNRPPARMINNRSRSSIKRSGDYYLYLLLFLDWRACTRIAQRSGLFLKEEAQHILLSLSASYHYLARSSSALSSKSRSTLSLSTTACRQILHVV